VFHFILCCILHHSIDVCRDVFLIDRFFFIILSHPPCSTLFPYTTLFRSIRRYADDSGDRLAALGTKDAAWWAEEVAFFDTRHNRSEEHTSELQSRFDLVCRLLLEKNNKLKD